MYRDRLSIVIFILLMANIDDGGCDGVRGEMGGGVGEEGEIRQRD